jgi:hypothetical protein
LHHTYLLFLELLHPGGNILDFFIRILSTTGISMLLIITVELLFPRKVKYRTNTAG